MQIFSPVGPTVLSISATRSTVSPASESSSTSSDWLPSSLPSPSAPPSVAVSMPEIGVVISHISVVSLSTVSPLYLCDYSYWASLGTMYNMFYCSLRLVWGGGGGGMRVFTISHYLVIYMSVRALCLLVQQAPQLLRYHGSFCPLPFYVKLECSRAPSPYSLYFFIVVSLGA